MCLHVCLCVPAGVLLCACAYVCLCAHGWVMRGSVLGSVVQHRIQPSAAALTCVKLSFALF